MIAATEEGATLHRSQRANRFDESGGMEIPESKIVGVAHLEHPSPADMPRESRRLVVYAPDQHVGLVGVLDIENFHRPARLLVELDNVGIPMRPPYKSLVASTALPTQLDTRDTAIDGSCRCPNCSRRVLNQRDRHPAPTTL